MKIKIQTTKAQTINFGKDSKSYGSRKKDALWKYLFRLNSAIVS